ncbi:helix-turn-helix domain-containing protein [Streptomyces sp. NPDC001312]|uniref:helix-turn-helix domain-containing protein n=1 Tax=Streptomyces sp. NPDC001312 TaxID=3364561 RepID=UPI0036ACB924
MATIDQPMLPGTAGQHPSPRAVAGALDPARITQARHLAALTKKEVAERIGVTPAAVGQYEAGITRPGPALIPQLAEVLAVPVEFFLAGRPFGKLDSSMAHFRSLRSTKLYQRARALGVAGQVWELAHALERRVQLPLVDLPGFAGGEVHPGAELSRDPVQAAQELRSYWGLGEGPISHLVRRLETKGIVIAHPDGIDPLAQSVDAFSTSQLPRPLAVLTKNRCDDVYRFRFTAAHELGHLVLHSDAAPGDSTHEREADAFAAEFLTPRNSLAPLLPRRMDLAGLAELQRTWGVSVDSLIYRCRELGLISDATASRTYKRLNALRGSPGFTPPSVSEYPGEQPVMLRQAFELAAAERSLTIAELAHELAWRPARVEEILGVGDPRPLLRLA